MSEPPSDRRTARFCQKLPLNPRTTRTRASPTGRFARLYAPIKEPSGAALRLRSEQHRGGVKGNIRQDGRSSVIQPRPPPRGSPRSQDRAWTLLLEPAAETPAGSPGDSCSPSCRSLERLDAGSRRAECLCGRGKRTSNHAGAFGDESTGGMKLCCRDLSDSANQSQPEGAGKYLRGVK